MRRFLLALAATLTAAVAAAAAGSAATLQLTESSARFPERAYVLTLPQGQRLKPSQVRVLENGHAVVDLKVVPAGESKAASFGTVLAIDTSNSMRGAPIRGAVAAARAFAARRNLNQRIAIVLFNSSPSVGAPFTTSQSTIDGALARPPATAEGTHLYDAVSQGITLLQAAGIGAGSVVVLSDGADTGSSIDLPGLIRRAQDAHVRVFTVGLRSQDFQPAPLRQLARETGASFSAASSAKELTQLYRELGLQLAREYLVTYNSIAQPGRRVVVSVSVAGLGKAHAGYVTPTLPSPSGGFHRSTADRVWQSSLAMILIALLIPALIGLPLFVFLRRRGNAGVRGRVAEFVSLPNREGEDPARRIFVGTERSLERTRWWGRFKESLEFADVTMPPVYVAVGTLILTIFAMWLFSLIATILFLVGLVVPFLVRAIINGRISRKQRLFGEQLPDNLDVVSSALRSGYSLVGALAVVVNNAPEPSRAEFQRVIADEQLGVPLEDALMRVSTRMKNRDIEQVALVSSLQGETGGNAAEVLDRVTESIRERAELRRLVRVLTAQGRFARWIVSALPITLLLLIWTINPTYIKPIFTHASGRIALVFAALMVTAGSVVIGKIVDIEV